MFMQAQFEIMCHVFKMKQIKCFMIYNSRINFKFELEFKKSLDTTHLYTKTSCGCNGVLMCKVS